MKIICRLFVLLFLGEASAAVARKPPAFSKPVYLDAYLPAAMQVIFHAVEQLKTLNTETTTSTTTSSTTEKIEETTLPTVEDNIKETEMMEMVESATETVVDDGKPSNTATQHPSTSVSPQDQHQGSSDIHEETPEMNYATPETNYETPEIPEQVQETNEELPEINEEESSKDFPSTTVTSPNVNVDSTKVENQKQKKRPTVDSIVEEIYEIVKPTSTDVYEDGEDDGDKTKSVSTDEKLEMLEEQEEEDRFTMLGEKVTQVPRPSLSSYLKRAQVAPRASSRQLASLYDALGKDARKQGYGKYFGYSDEFLQVLETSAEGGIGSQLKSLLEKVLEKNELTREDARGRTKIVLGDLEEPSSELSKDLRNLVPLRFSS